MWKTQVNIHLVSSGIQTNDLQIPSLLLRERIIYLTVKRIQGADVLLTEERLQTLDGGVAEDAGLVLEAVVALPDRAPGAVGRRWQKASMSHRKKSSNLNENIDSSKDRTITFSL